MQFIKGTIWRKVIDNDENVNLNAIVYALRNSCNIETSKPKVTSEEKEKVHPFLGWFPPEVAKTMMQRQPNWLT